MWTTRGAQRGLRRGAVGRQLRIGDGDVDDARILEKGEAQLGRIEAEVFAGPEREAALRVGEDRAAAVAVRGGFRGVVHVRREEEVEGRALLDLRREAAAGAIADLDLHARVRGLEGGSGLVQRAVEARGGGDAQSLRGGREGRERQQRGAEGSHPGGAHPPDDTQPMRSARKVPG
jgi:hypothetical protein